MAEKVAKITLSTAQKAPQSVIAPDINEIKGSIKVIDTKLDGTDSRIDDFGKRLSTKIEDLDKRISGEIRALSEKVDSVRDVERLKIEVAELKRRR